MCGYVTAKTLANNLEFCAWWCLYGSLFFIYINKKVFKNRQSVYRKPLWILRVIFLFSKTNKIDYSGRVWWWWWHARVWWKRCACQTWLVRRGSRSPVKSQPGGGGCCGGGVCVSQRRGVKRQINCWQRVLGDDSCKWAEEDTHLTSTHICCVSLLRKKYEIILKFLILKKIHRSGAVVHCAQCCRRRPNRSRCRPFHPPDCGRSSGVPWKGSKIWILSEFCGENESPKK